MNSRLTWITAICVFIVLFAGSWTALQVEKGGVNLHTRQAAAFLQHRLDISKRGLGQDAAVYNGKYYVPFPPFPAVTLLPWVVLAGAPAVKAVAAALALGLLSVLVFIRILVLFQVKPALIPWSAAAFFLGTAYWMCVRYSGGVWFYGQVVGIACLFLAVWAAAEKGWGWLAGLFLGAAFLSRQMMIFNVLFLAGLIWDHPRLTTRREKIGQLVGLCAVLALPAAVYLAYNALRFSSPLDTGYDHMVLHGYLGERFTRYGLFSSAYVPFNLVYMFLQGPHIIFNEPAFVTPAGIDRFGTSLTFASPFLISALWAGRSFFTRIAVPKIPVSYLAAWASILMILIPQLFYYSNGWTQWNAQRYALDFIPVLIVLSVLGAEKMNERLWKGMIVYAVLLNAWVLLALAS